jgi:hypothetical protein
MEPEVADELGTLVSQITQSPNAELGAIPSGTIFGLLIVAVEALITDESNYATGPASAMVGEGMTDFLSLKVRRLVGCTKSGPPSKD